MADERLGLRRLPLPRILVVNAANRRTSSSLGPIVPPPSGTGHAAGSPSPPASPRTPPTPDQDAPPRPPRGSGAAPGRPSHPEIIHDVASNTTLMLLVNWTWRAATRRSVTCDRSGRRHGSQRLRAALGRGWWKHPRPTLVPLAACSPGVLPTNALERLAVGLDVQGTGRSLPSRLPRPQVVLTCAAVLDPALAVSLSRVLRHLSFTSFPCSAARPPAESSRQGIRCSRSCMRSATPQGSARSSSFTRTRRLLHLMQYRSLLAAAAGGAAAFADVAAAGRAHLRSAGEAERGVGGAALLELDQLGGGVRAAPGRRAVAVPLAWAAPATAGAAGRGRRSSGPFLMERVLRAEGLGERHRVRPRPPAVAGSWPDSSAARSAADRMPSSARCS